ncbi:MAG: hypothetical protein ABSF80_05350 [Chitinispirillaceae bacterium]|jgi:hypothetical protein
MDYPSISAKIIGIALLAWTSRSVYRHFAQRKTNVDSTLKNTKEAIKPSITEQLLNNLLLYLWLAFMVVFSMGMILNN